MKTSADVARSVRSLGFRHLAWAASDVVGQENRSIHSIKISCPVTRAVHQCLSIEGKIYPKISLLALQF